nr:MAG TPA: hypothetical protein [Caudoviricetes sp.]
MESVHLSNTSVSILFCLSSLRADSVSARFY